MPTRDQATEVRIGEQRVKATLVVPATTIPGMLFIHGWNGNKEQYLTRARAIAALGCVSLTFDLRGNAKEDPQYETVTREHSFGDVVAAYDTLLSHPDVDQKAIGVVGSSYGGYLATILTTVRPVRWLALRAPAIYKDEDWHLPKQQLKRDELAVYRQTALAPEENRALAAASKYEGDVLLVESQHDDTVFPPVLANYRAAFERARSLTYRVIEDADHALSQERFQDAYTSILVNWASEMIVDAREVVGTSKVAAERPAFLRARRSSQLPA
jgi:dienelactone hydrolase